MPALSGKASALKKAAEVLNPRVHALLSEVLSRGSKSPISRRWHPTATVHSTAVVSEEALLDEDVFIGPFCHVGKGVVLGSGCRLVSHVSIHSNTIVGSNSILHPFASVGSDPQDLKYKSSMHDESWLVLGQENIVREHVSINRGTLGGGGTTSSGRSCLFMSSTHVSIERLSFI